MMTLHTAKGLEFPVVFVTGWEDGMFPHMRALGDPTELSEERRLAYVGITRARQRLYLSRAKVRSSWGQPMLNPESRFLREIPQELIDWRRTDPAPSLQRAGQRCGPVRHAAARPRRASAAGKRPLLVLEPGDRVTHDKYGLGRVEEVSGIGESAMSLIDFGSAGRVKLMHNHAPVHQALATSGRFSASSASARSAGSSASTTLASGQHRDRVDDRGGSLAPATNRPGEDHQRRRPRRRRSEPADPAAQQQQRSRRRWWPPRRPRSGIRPRRRTTGRCATSR